MHRIKEKPVTGWPVPLSLCLSHIHSFISALVFHFVTLSTSRLIGSWPFCLFHLPAAPCHTPSVLISQDRNPGSNQDDRSLLPPSLFPSSLLSSLQVKIQHLQMLTQLLASLLVRLLLLIYFFPQWFFMKTPASSGLNQWFQTFLALCAPSAVFSYHEIPLTPVCQWFSKSNVPQVIIKNVFFLKQTFNTQKCPCFKLKLNINELSYFTLNYILYILFIIMNSI